MLQAAILTTPYHSLWLCSLLTVATRQSAGGGIEPYLLRTYSSAAEEEEAEPGSGGSGKCPGGKCPGLPGTSDAQLWQAVEATSAELACDPPNADDRTETSPAEVFWCMASTASRITPQ